MPYTQRSKSLREGHSTQLLCLHRHHSEFTGWKASKSSRGGAQAVQWFKRLISRKVAKERNRVALFVIVSKCLKIIELALDNCGANAGISTQAEAGDL